MEVVTLSDVTLDGKLSLGFGIPSTTLFRFHSRELGEWFHSQRTCSDVIMVGANTIKIDDPQLTVRHVGGANPLRVVPSTLGDIPETAQILNDGNRTLIAVSSRASLTTLDRLKAKGVEVLCCGDGNVDLRVLLRALACRGYGRLLVEGGSTLLLSLLRDQLVDTIIQKHVPVIAGDSAAPMFLGNGRIPASRWKLQEWKIVGGVGVAIYGRESG